MMNMVFPKGALPEPVRYNPARDLAYVAPDALDSAFKLLTETKWAMAKEYREHHEVGEEDLARAYRVLTEFYTVSVTVGQTLTPFQTLTSIGWFDIPWEARSVVLMALGNTFMVELFRAIRQVSNGETHPCPVKAATKDALFLAKFAEAGPVGRWWMIRRHKAGLMLERFSRWMGGK
jgi:hypothetical protein